MRGGFAIEVESAFVSIREVQVFRSQNVVIEFHDATAYSFPPLFLLLFKCGD